MSGEFYFEKRVSRVYETVHVNKDLVYSRSRYYGKSKNFNGLRQLIVHITPVQKESRIEHCYVVYSLNSELKDDEEISVLSQGNASKRTRPYIHTSRETIEKLQDNLSSKKSVTEVCDLILEESGGPLKSTSQSQQPCDKRQIINCKGLLNSQKKQNKGGAEKEQTDEKDKNYEMLHQFRETNIVHSITIKKDAFFFVTTTEEIAQGIKQFCFGANASVLGVDATFNLHNMWVTNACYYNERISNPETGNNHIF